MDRPERNCLLLFLSYVNFDYMLSFGHSRMEQRDLWYAAFHIK